MSECVSEIIKDSYQLSSNQNAVIVAVSFLQLLVDHELQCSVGHAH